MTEQQSPALLNRSQAFAAQKAVEHEIEVLRYHRQRIDSEQQFIAETIAAGEAGEQAPPSEQSADDARGPSFRGQGREGVLATINGVYRSVVERLADTLPEVLRPELSVHAARVPVYPEGLPSSELAGFRRIERQWIADMLDWLELLRGDMEVTAAGSPQPNDGSKAVKGVSLQDAASRIRPKDADGQSQLVKAWHDSRTPKLPAPLGKDPGHAQRNLYEPTAILEFLKQFEGDRVERDFQVSAYFRRVSRYPRKQ